MKCSDTRPLLDVLCDGALEAKDSALVLDHLKSCDDCQFEWNDLEQMQATFHDAKNEFQLPRQLMERISEKLSDEERKQQKHSFEQCARLVPIMAIAASFTAIGFILPPCIRPIGTQQIFIQTASTGTLVEDLASKGALESVINRNELAKRVGYDLKYLRLPGWQMQNGGVYKSLASLPITRFDFVRGGQRLSCYQAPQGVIRTQAAQSMNLEGKHVLLGSHGKFQFALWSQNGRDYLFVTPLSRLQLEEIVSDA
jgi:hypothetical protein